MIYKLYQVEVKKCGNPIDAMNTAVYGLLMFDTSRGVWDAINTRVFSNFTLESLKNKHVSLENGCAPNKNRGREK